MATQQILNSKKGIYEFDGPSMAYIMLSDGKETIWLDYMSFAFQGSKNWVEAQFETLLREVETALPIDGCLIWRERWNVGRAPHREKKRGSHTGYCRFATSPPLPKEFWAKWEKLEGEPARLEG
jgi:hypothetical protein